MNIEEMIAPWDRDALGRWDNISHIVYQIVVSAADEYSRRSPPSRPSLVSVIATTLPITLSDRELANLPAKIFPVIPYLLRVRLGSDLHLFAGELADIDQWVENYENIIASHRRVGVHESHGLVSYADFCLGLGEVEKRNGHRLVVRPETLSGVLALNHRRLRTLRIPDGNSAYALSFSRMTLDILQDLDWGNVVVAGGIALGALHCIRGNPEQLHRQWADSDIDIFLYGLSSHAAERKLLEICSTIRSNLPVDTPLTITRNAATLTIYSIFPNRRVQIILRLYPNIREVLAGFDLDVCAMGWDGGNLWMQPRAARALETGYNVFSMNFPTAIGVFGRRASTGRRIFKYADKGYGIRFPAAKLAQLPRTIDFIDAAVRARTRTKQWVQANHYRGKELDLHQIPWGDGDMLQNWSVFFSHVELWDLMEWGVVVRRSSPSTPTVETQESDYSGSSHTRNIAVLSAGEVCARVDDENRKLRSFFIRAAQKTSALVAKSTHFLELTRDKLTVVQGTTHSASMSGAIEADPIYPVLMPPSLAIFLNLCITAIEKRLSRTDSARSSITPLHPDQRWPSTPGGVQSTHLDMFLWRIPNSLMWQNLDRVLAEIYLVLHVFRRLPERIHREGDDLQLIHRWALFQLVRLDTRRRSRVPTPLVDWVRAPLNPTRPGLYYTLSEQSFHA